MISDQTLALDLKGPGLNPMVLVDLPGIIQHHTRYVLVPIMHSSQWLCSMPVLLIIVFVEAYIPRLLRFLLVVAPH